MVIEARKTVMTWRNKNMGSPLYGMPGGWRGIADTDAATMCSEDRNLTPWFLAISSNTERD
jgi:hypothetical protein